MVIFYILNTILLIAALIGIVLQFLLVKTQHAMNNLNSVVLSIGKLFNDKKICCIDEYGRLRPFTAHTEIDRNGSPILCIELVKENEIDSNEKQ